MNKSPAPHVVLMTVKAVAFNQDRVVLCSDSLLQREVTARRKARPKQ